MPIPLIPYTASLRQGTEYLNEAIKQANASELVRQQAMEAIALTNTATSSANAAASNATTQANKADASSYAADLAATAALNARDGANTAKTAADTATGKANTATTQANTARDAANTAKTAADTAASNANAKAALANTATGAANTAADRANTAAQNVENAIADGPVISVNGKNGAVVLAPVDIGAEPAGALASAKTYTDTSVAAFVDSAPETLNTLNELAAALGDDPNFAATVATQIGTKVDKETGKGLFSGAYADLTGKPAIPTNTVSKTGDTMTGALVAQTNAAYTTRQVRNMIMSTADANLSTMQNGDIWVKYK